MQILVYLIATFLSLLGLVFIVGAQGQVTRFVIGIILLLGAGGLIALLRLRPTATTVLQQVDVSGDIKVKELKCQSCGGLLSNDAVAVKGGAAYVDCPFCGAAYQLTEQIEW